MLLFVSTSPPPPNECGHSLASVGSPSHYFLAPRSSAAPDPIFPAATQSPSVSGCLPRTMQCVASERRALRVHDSRIIIPARPVHAPTPAPFCRRRRRRQSNTTHTHFATNIENTHIHYGGRPSEPIPPPTDGPSPPPPPANHHPAVATRPLAHHRHAPPHHRKTHARTHARVPNTSSQHLRQ